VLLTDTLYLYVIKFRDRKHKKNKSLPTRTRLHVSFIIIIIVSFMEFGHLLTRSSLTYPEVSSKVYHDSFCQLGSSVSLPWVIYFETFYLHVVSSFSCIPVICPKLALFLTPLQFVHLFCDLFKSILLSFSCISSLLLLFFRRHLFNSPSFAAI